MGNRLDLQFALQQFGQTIPRTLQSRWHHRARLLKFKNQLQFFFKVTLFHSLAPRAKEAKAQAITIRNIFQVEVEVQTDGGSYDTERFYSKIQKLLSYQKCLKILYSHRYPSQLLVFDSNGRIHFGANTIT